MRQKLLSLFQHHLKNVHNLTFYPYQMAVAELIFDAVLQNFRITANATEEQIRKLRLIEYAIEISRQAGKTTTLVLVIDFIMVYFPDLFKRKVDIGLFAPQREQGKTDFDRLKDALYRSQPLITEVTEGDSVKRAKEESNAKTIVLPNGASCYVFPVTPTSFPESKTLDLIITDESQDLIDRIMKERIWPMGASTNAPRISVGSAGTQIVHFYRLGQTANSLKLYFEEIVEQRREVYKQTGDARHLIYEQTVRQEIEKYGLDSDEIQRPYFGKWLIGTGQFITQEDLDAITDKDRSPTYHDKQHECFIGIDTAKHPDSTVVTVLRWNPETKKKEVINWCELRGENYKNQFDIIMDFLSKYKVVAIAIDSTGQGEFMPDWIASETEFADERSGLYPVKFSSVSKDAIYKNLKVSIRELLTTLPKLSTRNGERFKQQMLDLQQEYKGQLLSVSHPDDPNAHDDYPDSWALAEWAYAKYQENNNVSAEVISITGEKERNPEKKDNKVYNYWPGE